MDQNPNPNRQQIHPPQRQLSTQSKTSGKTSTASAIRRYWMPGVMLLLVVILLILGIGYWRTRSELSSLSDPKTSSSKQATELVNHISKYLVLPNETPTIATVNDVSKLQGQQFFQNAQNGDKVLIFPKSGRALLYRPSTGKIIEYAPVNLNSGASNASQ